MDPAVPVEAGPFRWFNICSGNTGEGPPRMTTTGATLFLGLSLAGLGCPWLSPLRGQ